MMMRVGLLGVTHWHAAMHLDAVRHAGAQVVGVSDHDAAAATTFGARHGVLDLPVPRLLALRPDLVVVMGHPRTAGQDALAALAADLPIMLEKPAADGTAALGALTGPARNRFVSVPLANRCSPVWTAMSALDRAGRLGRTVHAQFRILNGPTDRYRSDGVDWLLDPAVAGGGALRNLGLHAADAALALTGEGDPVVLAAATRPDPGGAAVEGYATATLALPGGAIVTVEAGYTYASRSGGDYEWRVATANATLIDRGSACNVATLDDGGQTTVAPVPLAERYRLFMMETLSSLRRGAPPPAGLDDYLRAMRLVDRIYAAAAA